MTVSTNYGDLLKRQAWLQQAGAAHLSECNLEQIRVALLAEIGELAQELKPEWAWWRKENDSKQVDRDKVLGEAADVLHFALLLDLTQSAEHERADWKELEPFPGVFESVAEMLWSLSQPDNELGFEGWLLTDVLCSIVARYGFTPEDLARAYWEKTEVNLRRWAAAQ